MTESLTSALLLDIGNTSISYGYADDLLIENVKSLRHGNYQLDHLMDELYQERAFTVVLLASVYQETITRHIQDWCHKQQIIFKQATTENSRLGLINGYQDYNQMGVDRWLSMLAIWQERQSAFISVSCGSAVTYDLVDDNGQHQGGVIIPGYEMMQSCLKKSTVNINNTNNKNEAQMVLADSTDDAIANGALITIVSLIEKLMKKSGLDASQAFISGGDALVINRFLTQPFTVKSNSVISGLLVVFGDECQ